MSIVSLIVLCASAFFVQTIDGQCLHALALYLRATSPCASGCGPAKVAAASGGCLDVATTSLYAPNGLSVLSENDIAGVLDASGNLPVLAAVALEGTLPTAGSVGTAYSCGDEQVGINSDSIAAAGINGAGFGPGYARGAYAPAAYGLGAYAHGACAPGYLAAPAFAAPCGCY